MSGPIVNETLGNHVHQPAADGSAAPHTGAGIVVFLGPTMRVADAQAILPDATYLPPAAQSDIISVVDQAAPVAIAIIDGVFTQALSVWHKEILYALERGVAVYGASSMGALRVAETAAYGSVGIGLIFEGYLSGEITDDDEVAVMHATAEWDSRSLSDAMVNIRASLRAAQAAEVIDDAQHAELVRLAKARFFPERTYNRMLTDAAEAGMPEPVLKALRDFLATSAVDQKRADAVALLTHLRDQGVTPPPPVTVTRSHPFLAMYHRDRRVDRHGTQVPLGDISSYAALHLPDFREVNENALHAALVDVLAEMLDVTADDAEVAAERTRFGQDQRLRTAEAISEWAAANDLTEPEFVEFLRRQAVRRKLRDWLISRKYLERTTAEVLDELRLRGRYPAAADAAAYQQEVLTAAYPDLEYRGDDAELIDLVREQSRATGWRPSVGLDVWAFESGFKDIFDVRYELVRAKLARRATTAALDSLTGQDAGQTTGTELGAGTESADAG